MNDNTIYCGYTFTFVDLYKCINKTRCMLSPKQTPRNISIVQTCTTIACLRLCYTRHKVSRERCKRPFLGIPVYTCCFYKIIKSKSVTVDSSFFLETYICTTFDLYILLHCGRVVPHGIYVSNM